MMTCCFDDDVNIAYNLFAFLQRQLLRKKVKKKINYRDRSVGKFNIDLQIVR